MALTSVCSGSCCSASLVLAYRSRPATAEGAYEFYPRSLTTEDLQCGFPVAHTDVGTSGGCAVLPRRKVGRGSSHPFAAGLASFAGPRAACVHIVAGSHTNLPTTHGSLFSSLYALRIPIRRS